MYGTLVSKWMKKPRFSQKFAFEVIAEI